MGRRGVRAISALAARCGRRTRGISFRSRRVVQWRESGPQRDHSHARATAVGRFRHPGGMAARFFESAVFLHRYIGSSEEPAEHRHAWSNLVVRTQEIALVEESMTQSKYRRPTPEQLLKTVEAEERLAKRGKLKIFLGYASGVGKSFRMLDEGRRRKNRGQDVVIAATQPSAPPEVEQLLAGFEVIPPVIEGGRPAIDVPAVLRRHPQVCLIDGLAYDNPPGSKN